MNYPLLITVCSLAVGMVGMERWCSWRLSVAQKRGRPPGDAPTQTVGALNANESSEGASTDGLQLSRSVIDPRADQRTDEAELVGERIF